MYTTYYQQDGRIGARYFLTEEHDEAIQYCTSLESSAGLFRGDLGLLPEEIQQQGEEAMRKYAYEEAKRRYQALITQAKQRQEEVRQRRMNVNRIIQTEHKGVLLKGRITKHEKRGVIVVLEEPFPSTKGVIFDYPNCFAQSMSGARVFDLKTGELTSRLLRDAAFAIGRLYEEGIMKQKHPEATELVKALNREKE